MRRTTFLGIVGPAFVAAMLAAPQRLSAQAQPARTLTRDEIAAFAKVQVAIGQAHDSADAQLAHPRNKTGAAQTQLQEKLRQQIAEILRQSGMTEEEYRRKTFLVSTDQQVRTTFDSVVAKLTGVPTPGQVVAAPARFANLPAGPVGAHIGHVANSFGDTPNAQGLLPTALADARVAAQHAALAGRSPASLESMKLHAGHVLNALDPTIVAMGPGSGYGVKKATAGVLAHIDLAAKAPGASQNVIMHTAHITTASKNAAQRTDQVIELAKQVQAATDAQAAAALISQMVSLSQQITAGVDSNGDGRISWEEGGLQQADEHVALMVAGEAKPPL